MKYFLPFVLLLFFIPLSLFGQESNSIFKMVNLKMGEERTFKGNLSEGKAIDDLSWAWKSNVACFPETKADRFNGYHVLYVLELPADSQLEINLSPETPEIDLSVYAYMVSKVTEKNLVPNLNSCQRCEVDHRPDGDWVNRDKDDPNRSVDNILTLGRSKEVVIGVVGSNGLKEGSYTLELMLKKL